MGPCAVLDSIFLLKRRSALSERTLILLADASSNARGERLAMSDMHLIASMSDGAVIFSLGWI